jgi:protein-disulfide isomerase
MPMPDRRLMIACALAALALAGCNQNKALDGLRADAMSMGDPKAKVQVDEFASTTCSHCAAFNNEVFPAFKAKYVDTGKVHYTLHEFITPPEKVAAAGWMLARCVPKAKYFTVVDEVFRSQAEMYATQDPAGTLLKVAQSVGLTEDQFNACIGDPAALKALLARVDQAQKALKVNSTPTFYVNGHKWREGEVTLDELDGQMAKAAR